MAHRWVRHDIVEGMRLLEYHEDGKPMRLFLEVRDDEQPQTVEFSMATLKLLAAAMEAMPKCP